MEKLNPTPYQIFTDVKAFDGRDLTSTALKEKYLNTLQARLMRDAGESSLSPEILEENKKIRITFLELADELGRSKKLTPEVWYILGITERIPKEGFSHLKDEFDEYAEYLKQKKKRA